MRTMDVDAFFASFYDRTPHLEIQSVYMEAPVDDVVCRALRQVLLVNAPPATRSLVGLQSCNEFTLDVDSTSQERTIDSRRMAGFFSSFTLTTLVMRLNSTPPVVFRKQIEELLPAIGFFARVCFNFPPSSALRDLIVHVHIGYFINQSARRNFWSELRHALVGIQTEKVTLRVNMDSVEKYITDEVRLSETLGGGGAVYERLAPHFITSFVEDVRALWTHEQWHVRVETVGLLMR
ncbi:hypothetical protein BXZ70DRAFT_929477 [Cristinia sonorae]|uniref:Uncharacterized protein n=1 Tax=Cristinia sonorae TaxID=1940300 RepID=A0A8K0URX9_9AGAR|nr:hypothetical protein BXZ70DRAFT_929477 [Cristinia sonorae]